MSDRVNKKTRELVELACEGDDSAKHQLYRVYAERVRRVVRLHIQPDVRAEMRSMELVGCAFDRAFKGTRKVTYENEGDFIMRLARITEKLLADHWEKVEDGDKPDDIEHDCPPGMPMSNLMASRGKDLDNLEGAVDQMSDDYRDIVLLAKIDGLSIEQIAERLEMAPDATRLTLARGLAALSQSYESIS